jgi:hypothetical protein
VTNLLSLLLLLWGLTRLRLFSRFRILRSIQWEDGIHLEISRILRAAILMLQPALRVSTDEIISLKELLTTVSSHPSLLR